MIILHPLCLFNAKYYLIYHKYKKEATYWPTTTYRVPQNFLFFFAGAFFLASISFSSCLLFLSAFSSSSSSGSGSGVFAFTGGSGDWGGFVRV